MSTNLIKLINKCNYGPEINSDNDVKFTQLIDNSITYDDTYTCLELQTAYNLYSGVESSGSSYKYTTLPPIGSNSNLSGPYGSYGSNGSNGSNGSSRSHSVFNYNNNYNNNSSTTMSPNEHFDNANTKIIDDFDPMYIFLTVIVMTMLCVFYVKNHDL